MSIVKVSLLLSQRQEPAVSAFIALSIASALTRVPMSSAFNTLSRARGQLTHLCGIYCLISLCVGEATGQYYRRIDATQKPELKHIRFQRLGFFSSPNLQGRSGHVGLDRLPFAHQPHIL